MQSSQLSARAFIFVGSSRATTHALRVDRQTKRSRVNSQVAGFDFLQHTKKKTHD